MLARVHFKTNIVIALLMTAALFLVFNSRVFAHDRVEVGPYLIIIGWENEPPIVGDRNFLVVDISNDEEAVEGAEATLNLRVLYGGQTFSANLNPTSTPGRYKVDMYPTVRGQYIVEFTGSIGDTAVDVESEPEEVLPANVLQFPESPPDTAELQAKLDELTSSLRTARIMSLSGIILGVVGTIVGTVGALLKRKK